MKKLKLCSIVLFCVGILCLASCSKDSDGGVTLTVWESTGGPDLFIRKAGDAYTALHPEVKIKYVNVELHDAVTQIALDGPAGIGPDLFASSHDKLGELITGKHIHPIQDNDRIFGAVSDVCRRTLFRGGMWYGFPVSAETYTMFYNRDLIKESDVPKTWDGVVSFSKKFNATNPGKYGFMMDAGNCYYSVLFTTMKGNRLFSSNSGSCLDTPAAIEGMKFFQSLRKILDVPAADITTSVCDAAFTGGKCALYITGLWNIVPCIDAGISFGTAPIPSLPGESTPAASFSGIRTMFVSSYSRHIQEATDFASFLMSEPMQKLRFQCTGAIPAIKCDVNSPYIPAFQKQLSYSFPMPSVPQMNAFWGAMNNACCNIWNGADVQTELTTCNHVIIGQ